MLNLIIRDGHDTEHIDNITLKEISNIIKQNTRQRKKNNSPDGIIDFNIYLSIEEIE